LEEKTGENCLNNSLIAFFPVQIFRFTQVRHGKGKKAVLDSKNEITSKKLMIYFLLIMPFSRRH